MKLTPAKVTMLMLVTVGALIGMYVIKGLFAVEKKVARPSTVTIPLATAYLAPGTKISDTHVGLGPFPARELKEDHLRSMRVTVGRVVKKAIQPGSPLRGSELYEPGENSPLAVAEGKQAISINVKNPTEILDGLIKPDDYVDVHFTLDQQGASGLDDRLVRLGGVSMTLLKGVRVLAVNRGFRQSPILPTGNSITLELDPSQTNVLLVAQPRGTISFSFNPDGAGEGGIALSNSDRATLWEIMGLKKRTPKAEVKPEEPEKPFVTETFRGVGGGSMPWDKDGKKFDGSAAWDINRRGINFNNDMKNFGRGGPSPDDLQNGSDDFDPDGVFLKPDGQANDVPYQPNGPAPSADPDIPTAQPGTARSGVRSRVGSMLRARPKTGSPISGPTALRD